MSIIKHKISETDCFKQYIQDCLNDARQKYLDAIDNEINAVKEWERVSQERQQIKR